MKHLLLAALSFSMMTTHIQTMEKNYLQDSSVRLLDREAPFFEDISTRFLDREKVKLKEYLCDRALQCDYRLASLIKSQSNVSQNKDTVVITQTTQANDNRCMIHIKITLGNAYAEQNQNVCIVKQMTYSEFIEIMNKIEKSSDSSCCCC
ncbi:MAG: hypothetical protein NTZ68_03250 [Candidatus Dependentiae bacterium]|nr:hypothetical protein [Candidatus Dependentiae bacterium]